MKVIRLIKKFADVLKEEGILKSLKRVIHFMGRQSSRVSRQKDLHVVRNMKGDVLFINGYCLENPIRYRVLHQMEQLREGGMTCAKIYFEDIDLEMVDNFKMFVIFRCACTKELQKFIDRAREKKKCVCFDIDDLVIDTRYTDSVPFVKNFSERDKRTFDEITNATGKTLKLCDLATTTTEALAEELRQYVPRVIINRNTASKEMIEYSEKAYREAKRDQHRVWLGYFSGSLTHNRDFEIIRPAIMKVMEEHENVSLLLTGELETSDELKKFGSRVIQNGMVDWRKLPDVIAKMDINLAPLEDTLFNRAKSEIKWIEAALVRVPTIASRVGAFERMIEEKRTGFLVDNTEEEWYNCLKMLVEKKLLREKVGKQAYEFVKENCTTSARAEAYKQFICETIKYTD